MKHVQALGGILFLCRLWSQGRCFGIKFQKQSAQPTRPSSTRTSCFAGPLWILYATRQTLKCSSRQALFFLIFVSLCVCVHIYVGLFGFRSIYIYACTQILKTHTYIYIYISHPHEKINVYMRTYVHIHTYTWHIYIHMFSLSLPEQVTEQTRKLKP